MTIKLRDQDYQIFFEFFQSVFSDKSNRNKFIDNADKFEESFAQYAYDNKERFGLTDFEVGYISGASFMGLLESIKKTTELLGIETE